MHSQAVTLCLRFVCSGTCKYMKQSAEVLRASDPDSGRLLDASRERFSRLVQWEEQDTLEGFYPPAGLGTPRDPHNEREQVEREVWVCCLRPDPGISA